MKRLEIELRAAREATASGSGTGVEASSAGDADLRTANELLRDELELAKKLKKEREDALLVSKKQVVELHAELNKVTRVFLMS